MGNSKTASESASVSPSGTPVSYFAWQCHAHALEHVDHMGSMISMLVPIFRDPASPNLSTAKPARVSTSVKDVKSSSVAALRPQCGRSAAFGILPWLMFLDVSWCFLMFLDVSWSLPFVSSRRLEIEALQQVWCWFHKGLAERNRQNFAGSWCSVKA